MPRHPSWDSTYKGFQRSASKDNPFPANYYKYLNAHGYDDKKPKQAQELALKQVSWVGDVAAAVDEPYKVLLHLKPACSLNKMCYTPIEMALGARSLAGKPIFTNHDPVNPVGMWIHADWSKELGEVIGVGVLMNKHLWGEIKMHGHAAVSQRTHYFGSKKVGRMEYPQGIVFDEVSLIVDDENPGKPDDYVEALESWHAVVSFQHEMLEHSARNQKRGEKMTKGEEQATPPKAKLNPLVPFNKGHFGGPEPKLQNSIRSGEQTRYGQGYYEPPANQDIDLPAKYGPPLNFARIRGGPGVDIPFPSGRVQMPSRGGQPKAEPTAKPHSKELGPLPTSSRGPAAADPGFPMPPTSPAFRGPAPSPSFRKPASPSGNEQDDGEDGDGEDSEGNTDLRGVRTFGGEDPGSKPLARSPGKGRSMSPTPSGNEQDGEDDEEDGEDDADVKRKMPGGQSDGDGEDGEDSEGSEASEAVWTTAYINSLPDSAFAMPKERKYPHHKKDGSVDTAHVVNCAQRATQQGASSALSHCNSHMKTLGIGEYAKTAQERLQWNRYAEMIAPLGVIEEALQQLEARSDEMDARVGAFIDEALNKEFAKHKIGEFMRMFGPRLMRMEMAIEELRECASEMKGGPGTTSEAAPTYDSIVEEVLRSLNARAREVVNSPNRDMFRLPNLMGKNAAAEYAKRNVKNSLRQLGLDV